MAQPRNQIACFKYTNTPMLRRQPAKVLLLVGFVLILGGVVSQTAIAQGWAETSSGDLYTNVKVGLGTDEPKAQLHIASGYLPRALAGGTGNHYRPTAPRIHPLGLICRLCH